MMESQYYASFAERLERSKAAQKVVMSWVCEQGIPCSMNPAIMVPRGGDPNHYKDNGDLYMHMRTEVKHNPNTFWKTAESYPQSNITICKAAVFDDLVFPPKYYFIVNGPMTHSAIIDVARTKLEWIKADTTDHSRKHTYETYQISKSIPPFVKLRDAPKGTIVF